MAGRVFDSIQSPQALPLSLLHQMSRDLMFESGPSTGYRNR
ncbi:Uncharacterised protein [Mycobacterium tuberculosis]|nr:Uncharacterised protein [Mycobacterium tuberculosis]